MPSSDAGELGDKLQHQAANETAGLKPAHTVNGIALGGAFEQVQMFVCAAYQGKRYVIARHDEMLAIRGCTLSACEGYRIKQ